MPEGPFGEYTGYEAGGKAPRPVYHVKAITHRKNPILTASNMGMPIDDCDIVNSISMASDIRADLIRAVLPIVGVYDCTWPKNWSKEELPRKQSFEDAYPKEIQESILNNWREYGFKG